MEPNLLEQEVNQLELTDLVRRALDRPEVQITDWNIQQLHGGMELDSSICRVRGQATAGGETLPWSLIRKSVKPAPQSADPAGIWYWKREALAYQSGLLHSLPGGNLTAPACYAVHEEPDGSLHLWLEDIQDDVGSPWPLEQYARVARHLGQFNGAYLCGQSLPSNTCITHDWLRMYVDHADDSVEFIRKNPNHPIIRHLFPGPALAQVLAIWDEHKRILDTLDGLPQVFCHQDAFKRNLFARGGKTIAIDWGYAGIAPVGAELVALIAGSIGFWEIPAEKVMEMERLCFEAYLQGLAEAGWKGDPRLVRKGYRLTLLLRYPIGGSVGEVVPTLLDQARRAKLEATLEKPAAEIEKTDPAIMAFYQAGLPIALKLLGVMGLLRLAFRMIAYSLRLGKASQN